MMITPISRLTHNTPVVGNVPALSGTRCLAARPPAMASAGIITPKRPKARNEWFRHGECLRLIYDVLRDSAAPINTGEVVCRLMTIKGIESADRATARLFSKAVNSTLLRARDTIETVPVGKEMCWRIKAAA